METIYLDFTSDFENTVNPILFYITVAVFIVGGLYALFKAEMGRLWVKGLVPKLENYSEENLIKIYMSFAVLMIKNDKKSFAQKKAYLANYFQREFGMSTYDIKHTFHWSFTNEKIRIKSACSWMNKNIPDIGYQSQLLYFLTGIAIVDGHINRRERDVLNRISKNLNVPKQEIDAIITSYLEAEFRKKKAEQRAKYRNQSSKISKRKTMAKILEVDENATFEEIKKAYRTLVKLHHPDRFQKNGPEQIKLAQARFIEIQKAYEYFEKQLK